MKCYVVFRYVPEDKDRLLKVFLSGDKAEAWLREQISDEIYEIWDERIDGLRSARRNDFYIDVEDFDPSEE